MVGTNGCQDPLVLTPPVAADGGADPVTFASGAAVSFDVDASLGSSAGGQVTWTIPATLGGASVTIAGDRAVVGELTR